MMPIDESDLRLKELELKAEDLAIRREEARAKIAADRRNGWSTSPLLLGLVGLLGTGLGAGSQGFWNARLERQKFESSLVTKALDTSNMDEAARRLRFLVESGLIDGLNTENIIALTKSPQQLPSFFGAAIRDRLISVRDAKAALAKLGFYHGEPNDQADEALRLAVAAFQSSRSLPADGYLGPVTLSHLKTALPEHFAPKPGGQ
jgi:Putative peptidoglycan binding domain